MMKLRSRGTNNNEASDGVKVTDRVPDGHTKTYVGRRGGLRDASNAANKRLATTKDQGREVLQKEPEGKRRRIAEAADKSNKTARTLVPERPQSPSDKRCVLTSLREESVVTNGDAIKQLDINEIDPCPHYDFDAENMSDPNAVSIYAPDIFKYCAVRQKRFRVGDYMKRQKGLTKRSRAILGDWMVGMQQHLELVHETLHLSAKLMDLFFDRFPNTATEELQLVAASAMLIASKFEERWPPLLEDMVDLCDDAFTREDLIAMEQKMLKAIGFDVGCPLSYSFLRRYGRVCKLDMKTLTLARYVLETSLMFYEFVAVPESLMAAACLLLALRISNRGDWDAVLTKYSDYKLEEVEPLMWALNHMMVMRPKIYDNLEVVFDKYLNPAFFSCAATPFLRDVFANDDPVGPPPNLGFAPE